MPATRARMALQDEAHTGDILLERTERLSQWGGISRFAHANGKAKGIPHCACVLPGA